jgi:gliding motility-associated lipoprotein GldH
MYKFLLWPALLSALLVSCGSDYVFQEEKEIPGGIWTYKDTLDFKVQITDTAARYDIYLDFRYQDSYAGQNLYLKLHTLFPGGPRLSKVASFDLFDEKGEGVGRCSGEACSVRMVLQENAYFNKPGDYLITLEQYTRRDSLPGILAVGMALEKKAKN